METNAGVPQPIPEVPARPEGDKQQQWDAMTRRVEGFRDGLGMRVDPGIKETVVALNILGFQTRQSCEGHLDRHPAPWVRIQPEGVDELHEQAVHASDAAEEAEGSDMPEDELDVLHKRAADLRKETRKPLLEDVKKMMGYLGEFYSERGVPYDRRLTIQRLGTSYGIDSQGADLQNIADPKTKQQKLQEYQAEMQAFAGFLKERYFSSEQNSTMTEDTK